MVGIPFSPRHQAITIGVHQPRVHAHIGLGSSRTDTDIARYDKEDDLVADTWTGFLALMALYDQRSQGYQARQAMEKTTDSSDYDHLSRYGEWTESDPFDPEDVG